MNVYNYKTAGGKDLIVDYIDKLPNDENADGMAVLKCLKEDELEKLRITHWRGSIYEIYFYKNNRLFYVSIEGKDAYLLHACRKQKNKTEKKDGDIVVKRAKELGSKLGKKFI